MIAPEDYDLVNQGKIFTPFWKTPTVIRPGPGRRRQLAAELL